MFQVDHVGDIVGDQILVMKYSDTYDVKNVVVRPMRGNGDEVKNLAPRTNT